MKITKARNYIREHYRNILENKAVLRALEDYKEIEGLKRVTQKDAEAFANFYAMNKHNYESNFIDLDFD